MVRGLDVPVIPIGLHGAWGHPFSCKGGDAFRSWEKLWRPRITVRVGAPIHGPVTPEELRQAVMELVPGEQANRRVAVTV